MPKQELLDDLVRDLCSVEYRVKSKTRRLVYAYTKKIKEEMLKNLKTETELLIAKEINICRQENTPTSRLTSLYNKIGELFNKLK